MGRKKKSQYPPARKGPRDHCSKLLHSPSRKLFPMWVSISFFSWIIFFLFNISFQSSLIPLKNKLFFPPFSGKGPLSLIGLRRVSHLSLPRLWNHTLSGPLKPHGGFYSSFCSCWGKRGCEEYSIITLNSSSNFKKGTKLLSPKSYSSRQTLMEILDKWSNLGSVWLLFLQNICFQQSVS